MTVSPHARVLSLPGGRTPRLAPDVLIADGARIVGDVAVGARSSVWYNAVLRGDSGTITLGERVNVQDGVVVHVAAGHDVVIGDDVSIGHNAVVHGCTIEAGSLVGMGAVVLSGAVVGAGSLVAAGAVVLEGTAVPPGSLVVGVPARVRRALTAEEIRGTAENAAAYLVHAADHASSRAATPSSEGEERIG